MARSTYYGWLDGDTFCLSQYPPDAPVRPHIRLDTIEEIKALTQRRRADVLWWPPLPDRLNGQI